MTYYRDHARVWDPFGRYPNLNLHLPAFGVGVIMAPTVEAGLHFLPFWMYIYTSSKNETLAMFQGGFFPVVMLIHVGTIQLRKLMNCSVTNREASLNFFFGRFCCRKGVGVGGAQIFYTPNLLRGFFLTIFQSLGWFLHVGFSMFWPSCQACLARDTSCTPPFFWFQRSNRSDSFIVGLQIGSVEYVQREKISTE